MESNSGICGDEDATDVDWFARLEDGEADEGVGRPKTSETMFFSANLPPSSSDPSSSEESSLEEEEDEEEEDEQELSSSDSSSNFSENLVFCLACKWKYHEGHS